MKGWGLCRGLVTHCRQALAHRWLLESNDFPVNNDLSNDVSENNPESENKAERSVKSYSYKDAVVGGKKLVTVRSRNWADNTVADQANTVLTT